MRKTTGIKTAAIAIAVFVIAATASAQIPTSGNIFVGYSVSQANSFGHNVLLNGWEGSLEAKFLPWIGIVGDFSAGYGSDYTAPPITCAIGIICRYRGSDVRRYTYLVGPRVSIPIGRFTPFANALFGAAHESDRGQTDTSFATAIGGGLDYRLIKGVALRLQADDLRSNLFGVRENHFRFSTGIDIRF